MITKADMRAGECGGYCYDYAFEGRSIDASGGSLDFCRPIEGLTFRGFRNKVEYGANEVDGCSLFPYAFDCEYISPDVILTISFPESRYVCDPYVDTIFDPIISVAVNLPRERTINGMNFSTYLLSNQMAEQLFAPLGGRDASYNDKCKDAAVAAQFDAGSRAMAQAVLDGQADEETNERLNQMREFARSITALPDACIPFQQAPFVKTNVMTAPLNIAPFEVMAQALSPDEQLVAFAATGLADGQQQSVLAILDVARDYIRRLRYYQPVEWEKVEIEWSPNNSFVAFQVSNEAYSDDGGLWLFKSDGREQYHLSASLTLEGWSENSQYLYFSFEDVYGYVNVDKNQYISGPRCP
ncbi:MAG: hypothetical protein JXA21_20855 [Anaerolineae bacterium]|nr:hypothetical protein [Anaerolineae bacterium]